MKLFHVLILFMMALGGNAYSQIIVTNPGTGPARPPIDPPPVDNPIPVRPTTPDGTGIFDGTLYQYCGPSGYKCNLMRSNAVSVMLSESKAYSAKQLKAHQTSLDTEMGKLDKDLESARSGVVGENSPAGQVLKEKLATAANKKAQAASISDETLAFQIKATNEQSSNIDVSFGLAYKEQDKREYREEARKVELVVVNRFLNSKIKTEMERADAIEAQINRGNFSNKEGRLEMVGASRAAFEISAQSLSQGDVGKSDFALKVGTGMLDMAISVTPFLGWGKDMYEAAFGKNLITGEELSGFERSMAVVGVLTAGIGSKLAIAGKGAVLIGVIKSAKGADEAAEAAKIVDRATDFVQSANALGWKSTREAFDDMGQVVKNLAKEGKLPPNYITKYEAQKLGWDPKKGNLGEVAPGKVIGGDVYKNRNGKLPDGDYREADVGFRGGFRGSERVVYSSDGGKVYFTNDHYESFTEVK
jgi:hypothetical protein